MSLGTWPQRILKRGSVQVGWKHQEAVAMLEEKRKVGSAAFYQAKKKQTQIRLKAKQEALSA